MATRPGYPPPPQGGGEPGTLKEAANSSWVKQLRDVLASVLTGKLNAVLEVTLAAGVASTIVKDARISVFSAFYLEPETANAAAALYTAPYVRANKAAQMNGQVTLLHANNAQTDRIFNLLIIG